MRIKLFEVKTETFNRMSVKINSQNYYFLTINNTFQAVYLRTFIRFLCSVIKKLYLEYLNKSKAFFFHILIYEIIFGKIQIVRKIMS